MKSEDSSTWAPAFGWEEFYEVSDAGVVRSLPRPGKRKGKWTIKPFLHDGYPKVMLNCKGRKTRCVNVSRLVLESFTKQSHGRKLEAAHKNGIKKDCRLENLYWATREQNEADKLKHGTIMRGERHHGAKLNAEKVKAIRLALFRDGEPIPKIAKRFKVTYPTITAIRDGRTWKHIPTAFREKDE